MFIRIIRRGRHMPCLAVPGCTRRKPLLFIPTPHSRHNKVLLTSTDLHVPKVCTYTHMYLLSKDQYPSQFVLPRCANTVRHVAPSHKPLSIISEPSKQTKSPDISRMYVPLCKSHCLPYLPTYVFQRQQRVYSIILSRLPAPNTPHHKAPTIIDLSFPSQVLRSCMFVLS